MVVPRNLLECDEGQVAHVEFATIGHLGFGDALLQSRVQDVRGQSARPECDATPNDLGAVVSRDANRADRARFAVDVHLYSSGHVHCAAGNLDAARREVGESNQHVAADGEGLVRLLARLCDRASEAHVLAIAIGAAERVAGQCPWGCVGQGHDHATIEPAGQRHGCGPGRSDVLRQQRSERVLQANVELLVWQCFLGLPPTDVEIGARFDDALSVDRPARCGWQQRDAVKEAPILDDAAEREGLGECVGVDSARLGQDLQE